MTREERQWRTPERFLRHVLTPKTEDDCWLWAGGLNNKGYGVGFYMRGRRSNYAHRASYLLFCGSIPPGLYVLHSCDVRACVNPAHLFLGTAQDNTNDMIAKGRMYDFPKLERNHNAKLTSAQVLEARRRRAAGEGLRALAREYGVSHTALWHAITGINWATLDPWVAPARGAGGGLEEQLRASLAQKEQP